MLIFLNKKIRSVFFISFLSCFGFSSDLSEEQERRKKAWKNNFSTIYNRTPQKFKMTFASPTPYSVNFFIKIFFIKEMILKRSYTKENYKGQITQEMISPDYNSFSDEDLKKTMNNIKNNVYDKEQYNVSRFKSVLASSCLLESIVTEQGIDLVVCLGRTPYLLTRTLKEQGCQVPVTCVPFSGSADIYSTNPLRQSLADSIVNKVTPEAFQKYGLLLESLGFSKYAGRKIMLVDMVHSGSGLNSFLKMLECYFEIKKLTCPKIFVACFGSLDSIESSNMGEQLKKFHLETKFLWYPQKNSEKNSYTLEFKFKEDHFTKANAKVLAQKEIPLFSLKVVPAVRHFCDNPDIQDLISSIQYYPPCLWDNREYDPLQKSEHCDAFGIMWDNFLKIVPVFYRAAINFEEGMGELIRACWNQIDATFPKEMDVADAASLKKLSGFFEKLLQTMTGIDPTIPFNYETDEILSEQTFNGSKMHTQTM